MSNRWRPVPTSRRTRETLTAVSRRTCIKPSAASSATTARSGLRTLIVRSPTVITEQLRREWIVRTSAQMSNSVDEPQQTETRSAFSTRKRVSFGAAIAGRSACSALVNVSPGANKKDTSSAGTPRPVPNARLSGRQIAHVDHDFGRNRPQHIDLAGIDAVGVN